MENNLFQEFIKPASDSSLRNENSFSDELVFRKAKIYKCLGPKDDRLQVQILPELQGIPEDEMDNLPKYPPFQKGNVITGKDHINDGDKAEFVWCVCTPDLQVGYIMCKANIFSVSTEKYPDSYSYSDIKAFCTARRALPNDFDYNHLDIVKWYNTDKGGSLECYNYLTGDWILLNTSGSMIAVLQQQIYLRTGTPPSPQKSGPVSFSAIRLTPDKIHLKSINIELDAQDVILAHHGLYCGGILGVIPSVDNGVPVMPVTKIHV